MLSVKFFFSYMKMLANIFFFLIEELYNFYSIFYKENVLLHAEVLKPLFKLSHN